jgi:hypothetical protein
MRKQTGIEHIEKVRESFRQEVVQNAEVQYAQG